MDARDVVGFEGLYVVSESGDVFRVLASGYRKPVKPWKWGQYDAVYLYNGHGARVKSRIHRIVAEAWVAGFSDGMVVDHIDRDKLNNHANNLRWVTRSENNANNDARGYSWHKRAGKWAVHVVVGGRKRHVGLYATEDEARAARAAALGGDNGA